MPVLMPFDIARFLPRGLLGHMDEQDEPGGLLGADEEQAPSANGLLADDHEGSASSAEDRLMQELLRRAADQAMRFDARRQVAADFFGRILTNPMGIRPPTYDPMTGVPHAGRYLENLGDRFSENTKALPLSGLPGMRPPGPTASAPVTFLPRSALGFPFGGPGADPAENNEVYHLPPEEDRGENPDGSRQLKDGSKYWPPYSEGPLSRRHRSNFPEQDQGTNVAESFRNDRLHPVRSFRGGSYVDEVLEQDELLYRLWGGQAGKLGPYLLARPPASRQQARIDNAILPEWGNTMEKMTIFRVPKGTRRFRGTSEFQRKDVGHMVGGGDQSYIPYLDPLWEIQTLDFK